MLLLEETTEDEAMLRSSHDCNNENMGKLSIIFCIDEWKNHENWDIANHSETIYQIVMGGDPTDYIEALGGMKSVSRACSRLDE